MAAFSYDLLRRWPDVEAENLFAVDATDRLIIDEAAGAIRQSPDSVAVVGDHYGALTLAAVALHGAERVRVHQDLLTGERALANNAAAVGVSDAYANHPLDTSLVEGARVVLVQLPKSLAALREIAELISAHAHPEVVVYAGGRIKHMTRTMNEVLAACFADVTATLARQKSRVLVARAPRPDTASTFPLREHHDDLDLWVCAHGAAFGGTKIDFGTRLLLEHLPDMAAAATTAVDLGCGTGVLAAALARSRPDLAVLATDDSYAAVASTVETVRANDLADRVTVVREDALTGVEDASVDLVVCNPPFHLGTTVHDGVALKLFADAARALRPGGELWTVYNTPLGYVGALERLVGPTLTAGRNGRFTVSVSHRGHAAR